MSALAMAAWMSSRCSCGAKGKASACPRGGIGREKKGDPKDIFDWRRSQGFVEDAESKDFFFPNREISIHWTWCCGQRATGTRKKERG